MATNDHRSEARGYNDLWRDWLQDNPDATKDDVLDYGRELMLDEYGFNPGALHF